MLNILFIGSLGKDAVVNNANGKQVINFSVGVSVGFGDNKKTQWCECSYWTDKAGLIPYLKKGQSVYIDGTPEVRSYTTNDGKQGASLKVIVRNIELLGSKQQSEQQQAVSVPAATAEPVEDDLPF